MLAVPVARTLRRLSGLLVVAASFLLTNCSLDELVSPTPGGVLTVAPLEIADSARVGSTARRTQTITLGIDGPTASLSFGVTAELGSTWIVDGLGTGNAPNDWTIGFDPTGLAVGEYRDTLRVSNSGPDSRLVRVPVLLKILPCEIIELDALPATVSSELTAEDCASTSQTDRFAKRFQFTGAVDDSVTVRVIASDFTPRVTLRVTGAMSPIGFADTCPATGSGACTRYVRLAESGTYEVEVTSTAAGATGDFEVRVSPPRAPAAPSILSQRVSTDLTQVIAAGSTLSTDRIALQASLTDADLDSLRLEIELRPIATPFTNSPTSTSALLPGPTFTQSILGLTDNTVYRWQARAVDVTGRTSAWVPFGNGSADFSVGVPEAPLVPSALIQRKVDGTTPIALGGTTDESIIRLGATVTDPDPLDQVRLELEVRPFGTAFTNVATHSSALQAPGSSVLVSVAGLVDNGQYRWQSRAVDQTGRTSAWTPFGGASAHFRTALTPTQLSFLTGPSTAAAGAAITPSVRVAVQDAGGSTLASYTGPVTLALDNANGATLGGTTTINAVAGVATFTDLSVDLAGTGYTLTATAGTLEETSAAFDVTSAAAANMLLSAVPVIVTAGQTISSLTVTVRDALGNVATGFTGMVTLALAANANDAELLGTTSVAAVAGVATFSDVRVERASSALTIVASATGLANVSSTSFAVTAATAAQLAMVTEPATAAASGVALNPQPVLEIRDAFGNPVLVSGTAATGTIASGPGGSTLNGASVNTTADGRATFSALAIVGAAGSYTLQFASGALSAAPAAAITIGAGAATQLTISIAPPATAVNGVAFGSEVRARLRDAAGNPVLQAGVSVAVSIASGGGTLTGTTTVLTNTMGQAIFSDLGLLGTVGARTLAFASTGLTGATSSTVTLVAGAATTLALQAGDGQTAAAANTVSIAPSVIAADVSGNPVAGVNVTFEVTSGGGLIEPSGVVVTGSAGIAALTTWTLGGTAGSNTLTASADALDGSPILFTATATAGAASQITITGGDDLTGEVATTLATPHEVRITDATGNPVAGVTVNWTAIGGGSVAPASSVTDADGRATTERTLGPTAGAQSTQASATLAGGLTTVTFDITATVGGATQLTLAGGDAQVDTVGATLPTPLSVLVRDALNNPVAGVQITWSVLAGGGAVTPSTSLTDASGTATTSWRLGTTRTATDSTQLVRASGVASPVSFVALARAGAVNPSQTLVSVLPTSVAASRGTPATVTVTARDGFGNPVAGVPVSLAATGDGNTIAQPVGVTSATGITTGAVGATVTGSRTISATVNGVLANATPTLTVVAAPAATLLFLDAPSTAVAGDDLTPSPSMGVLDSLGNRNFTFTGNVTLGLGVNPNGGALSGTLSRNAVAGVATFPGVAIDRAGGGYRLSASSVNMVSALSAELSVSAGALSAAQSTLGVDPASIIAGSGSSTITVTARDENNNPIAGATVVLSASGSNNSLTQPVALTDANGVATGSISATTTGSRTISTTVNGLGVTQTAVVSVVAGDVSPTLSTITGIPSTLVAGVETSNVTVTARDGLGNAIPGATVVINATGSGNTITQPSGPTNSSGVAVGTFVSTVAELKTLSATINGVALATSASVTVNPGAVSASRSLVAAAPDSIVAAEGSSTITVTARDAHDNLINGATVVLAASGAGNSLTQPVGPTGPNGITTGSLGSTAVGNKTVSATINGIAITQSALVRVFAAGVSASQSAVEITDASIVAGDSTIITVIARDANGNAVSGAAVVLASNGTGDVITQPAGVTDASGVATGRVRATIAGARNISATIASIAITQTVALAVTSSVPDAAVSSLGVDPASIAADGTAAVVTATVRDEFGNAVPGVAVVLAASGSGNVLTQPSALTDAAGVATGSISATIAGVRDISATAGGLALADTLTLTVTPAAVSAAQSTVSVDPASLTAGVGSSTVTIVARDANGNVVPGLAVTFAVSGAGNTLTQPAAVTDGTGTATGSVSSTGAGAKTITATIAGVVVSQTASLTVSPAAISAATSTVSVSAGTISAGVASTTITVTVRDAFNNPIPGVLVELAATGSDNTLTQPAGVTNASGVATGAFSSTNSESKTISATAGGIALTQTATVTVVPDAASATASLVSASATTLMAGTDTATITVTARDANENPVPGVAVTLEANGSGVTFVQPAAVTDANGVATGRVTGTVVGARTVTALLNGVPASTTIGLTITPATVSGDSTLFVIAPSSIVAGSPDATVTVTARDAFGNVVPGVTVGLSATGASVTLIQPGSVTDAAGVTSGGITATLVGAKIVSATVNGAAVTMTDTLTVTPAAVSASESTIGAAPAEIIAGGAASTITVTARDAFGNVVPGMTVTLSADGTSNTLVQPAAVTNASGVTTGTLASTATGVRTVGASIAGTLIAATTTVTVNPAAVSASLSTIGAEPSSIVAGGTPSTITVQVRDLFGNSVPGATVALIASGALNTLVQPEVTDADGLTTGTLASLTAEVKSVSAIANGVTLAGGVDITVTAGAVSATSSSLTATPGTLTAGAGSSTITVTARDANNNLIPNAAVVLFASGSGNTLTQPSGNTGVDGVASGALSSTAAGVKSITATVNGELLAGNPSVTVSAGAIDGAQSTLALDPVSIVADGTASSTATITVHDAFGNPITGATVVVSASPATGTTVTGPLAATNAVGITTSTIASTVSGDKTISATAGGVSITGTQILAVTPGAVSGTQSTIEASDASIVAGSGTSTITVMARDAEGNIVPNAAVTLSASGSGNSFTPAATGNTDANGQFEAIFGSTAIGTKTITASIAGTGVSGSALVTVTAASISAAQSLVSATPTTLVAGADTSIVTVTVRDEFSNPIQGATVTFGATGTGNTLLNPVAATNASGVTTGRFTSESAEAKVLTATAGGIALTQTVGFTVMAAGVSADESSLSVTTAQITAGTTDSTEVTVTARDEFGNLISGASVQLLVSGGTNNFASAAGDSDANGVFVGYVRSTSAGAKVISATIAGVTVSETGAVTVVPAGISAGVSTVAVSTSTLFAGSGSATVTVTVRDAFSNPISGATVVVSATGDGNTVTGPSATTNVSGVATATFSSTVSELKTISATANGTPLTQQPTINVVPGEISATQSEVVASAGSVVAGSGSSTITVTARDANGNAVPGVAVTLVSPSVDAVFTQPGALTDANGVATGSIGATIVGVKRISAELNGVAVADTVDVAVTPAAVDAGTTTVAADPTSIVAGGTGSTITVTARDAFGNPVPSAAVDFAATGTGNTLTPSATANASGIATGTLTSTVAAVKTVSVIVNDTPITQTANVTVTPGAASLDESTITAAPTAITTDGSATITVQLRDAFQNALTTSGGVVVLNTTVGALGTVTNNNNGSYTASLTSSATGTATITGTLDALALTDDATVTIGVGAASLAQSTITADPTSITTDGNSAITVQLRDGAGNNLTMSAGTVTLSTTLGLLTAVTDNLNGTYTASLTSTSIGSATITGTLGGADFDAEATVVIGVGAPSPLTSQISANPTAITTDGSSTITVQLRDAANNNLTAPSGTVTLASDIGQIGIVTSVGNGSYTATFTSGALGTATITGEINGQLITDQATVAVSIGGASLTTSTITASPDSITTDGSSTITVQVRDGAGNNYTTGGATVALATDLGVLTGITDVGNGTYTATLTSTLPGTATVTGQLSSVAIADNAVVTVQVGAPSLTTSTITASATSITTDDGSAITVQLRDAAGNALTSSGGTVTLATTLGTLSEVTNNSNGTYSAMLTSDAVGTATITGQLDGNDFTDDATVSISVGAPSAAQTTITADPTSMTVDGSSLITVQLRDAAQNNITTGAATIALGTTLGDISAVTNVGDGTYTATLTSEDPGTATVTGTLNAAAITDNAVVTVTSGAVSATLSTVAVGPTSIVAGSATSTVTITAVDQFGNPVQGMTASFVATGTGNTLVQPVSTTDASGVTTGTISSTVAQQKSITGTAGGVQITTPAVLTVTPAAVSSATSTLGAGTASIIASSGANASTITLTARDEFSNLIENAAVTFSSTGTANGFSPASGTTNSVGVLTTAFSSETAEPKTISAVVAGTTITQTAAVTVTPAAASALTSQITANPTSVSSDVGTSTVTVTLRDAFDNALVVGGDAVTLATTLGSFGAVANNGDGTYSATLTATTAGTAEISGTVNAANIVDTATVTITSGGVSAAESSVEVSSATLVAGAPAVTIAVTARDASGNAVEGATVVLGATGDNTLTQPVGPTDANGVATGSLAATLVGERTISATVAGVAITETASVTVTPAVASTATSTITASSNSITTDGNSTLTVQLRDQYSNLVTSSGGTVTLTPSIGAVGEVTDNLNGTYSAIFTSGAVGTANITGTLAGSPLTDTEDITVTVGNSAPGTTTITAADASIAAGGSTTLTVQLRDAAGNARTTSNGMIELSASIGSITDLTDVGNGTWTATFTSNAAGTATISGELNEVAISDTEVVTVNAAAVSAGVSTVMAGAPTIVAGSGTSLITVTALDQFSNPVVGASVEFETSGSGNTFAPSASATTDVNGQATATFSSTQATAKVIVVTVGLTEITQQPTVTVTPAAINAGTSSVVLTPSSVAATVSSTVTVTARDAFNNPVPGATVMFSATGTDNTLTLPTAATDVNGIATGSISSTFAEEKVITAIAGGVTITQTPTLTVTVGGVSPSQSTVVAQQASIVANNDGSETSTILVTALDANGNPIEGATVTLASSGSSNVFVQPVATAANGQTTGTIRSTRAEVKAITATVNDVGISQQPTVTVTAAAVSAAQSIISADPTGITTDGTSAITVQARDAFENPRTSTSGEVLLTSSIGGALSVTDNLNGSYSATLSPASTGTATISGTIGGVAIGTNATVAITAGAAALATSQVTVANETITAGGNTAVTVTLRDAENNALTTSGGTVTLERTLGSVGSVGSVTDNSNGTYTATFSSNDAGSATLEARLNGNLITDVATVTVESGTAAAAQSSVEADSAAITASSGANTTIVTVTVRDALSNPVAGATVALSADGSDNAFTQPVGTTNASGVITGTFSSTRAEPKIITATVGGSLIITETAGVTVVPAPASAATSSLSAMPPNITADLTSTITVQLIDAFGNVRSDGSATLVLNATSGGVSAPVNQNDGTYDATFTPDQTGTITIGGTLGDVNIVNTTTVTVTPGAPSGAQSTIALDPASITASSGASTSTITATARDGNGNPIPGATVVISASGTGNTLNQGVATADGSGAVTATISSTVAESKTISALINGSVAITSTQTLTVTVGGVSAAQSTAVAQQTSIVANDDGSETSTILVTALDANGNPIEGATVTLASTGTNNVFVQPGATAANGQTTGTLRSTTAELKTITATIGGIEIDQEPTVTVTVAAASAAQSIISANPTSITTDASSAITVQARDAFGNLRTATSGEVLLTSSIGGALSVTDNLNGSYSATLAPTATGTATISGTLGGIAIGTNATVTVTPGLPSLSTSQVTAANATITAGGNTTVTVELRDADNNPLTQSAGTVTLGLIDGSVGSIGSVTDNTNGTYTATFSSTQAGSATIEARLDGNLITDVATVTVETGAAAAAQSSVEADSTSLTASSGSNTTTVTVTVRDANNNAVAGATVTLSADGSDNAFTQPVGTTNASGAITGTFSSTRAEAKTITATVGGSLIITETAGVTVVPAPASAATSTLSATPTSVTADQTSTITVQLIDAFGNVRSDGSATLVLNVTSGGISAPVNQNDGTYDATFTPDETGTITIGGTLGGVNIVNTTTVTVTPGAPTAAQSAIALNPTSIAASSGAVTSTITATARDANGNPIPGATVVISATGTGNALVQAVTTADANGAVTATISSTVAESKTISALINGTVAISPTQTLTVTAGAMDPDLSSLAVSDASIVASNGSVTSTITATIRDANNNPINNATVSFLANGVTTGLSAATAQTNASGVAQVTFSSTATGLRTILASVNAVSLSDAPTIDVTPGAASPTTSLITASNESITSDETSTITVRLRDEFSNNLTASAGTVTLLATPGGALTVTPVGDGSYTATFDATTATTVTITGQLNGLDLTDNAVIAVSVGAVSATQSTITVDPTSFVAGNSTTIEVIARDGANNLIGNVPVVLGFTGNAGTLTQPSGNTDVAGEAIGSFAATLIGDRTISATVNGVPLSSTAVVSVAPAASSAAQTLITTADASFTAGGSTTVTIQVRDQFGNVVTTTNDAIVLSSSIGAFGTVAPTGPGTYEATFSSDSADIATITGTLNTVVITDDAIVTVNPGAATTLVIVAQPTSVNVSVQFPSAIQVEARDQFGNLASSFSGTVTVALQTGLDSDLGGTKSLSASNGAVSFADLVYSGVESSIVLVVSAVGVVNSVTSAAITVN